MKDLYADIMKDFEGYTIGKMLAYLNDPKIISFAGGLPNSDVFPVDSIQNAAQKAIAEDSARVLQYSPIPGEQELMLTIIDYLKKDDIHIEPENIMITTSGQHGLDHHGEE